jgi:hypothetical protein
MSFSPSPVAISTATLAGRRTWKRSSSRATPPNRLRACRAATRSSTMIVCSNFYREILNYCNVTNGSSSKPSSSAIEQRSGVRDRTARPLFDSNRIQRIFPAELSVTPVDPCSASNAVNRGTSQCYARCYKNGSRTITNRASGCWKVRLRLPME